MSIYTLIDGTSLMGPVMKNCIREKELVKILGVSRNTLWRWERDGKFPARRQLGPNCVAWLVTEVEQWLHSRPLALTDRSTGPKE